MKTKTMRTFEAVDHEFFKEINVLLLKDKKLEKVEQKKAIPKNGFLKLMNQVGMFIF